MTSSEIEQALKLANCTDQQTCKEETTTNQLISTKTTTAVQQQSSLLSTLFKWIKNLLIAGCFAFTAYKLLIKVNIISIQII